MLKNTYVRFLQQGISFGDNSNSVEKPASQAVYQRCLFYLPQKCPILSCCCFCCVNIGTDEEKFPTVFSLLTFNHLLYTVTGVFVTSILLTICGGDKHRVCRYIFGASILMNVTNMVDSTTNCINESRGASDGVFFVCHRTNSGELYSSCRTSLTLSKRTVYT